MEYAILVGRQDAKKSVAGLVHECHIYVVGVPSKKDVVEQFQCSGRIIHVGNQQKNTEKSAT